MAYSVTPWDVSGRVDYEKLMKEFGTMPITPDLLGRLGRHAPLHTMLRRGYFFSHRDLDLALKDHEAGKGFFLYTGRAPAAAMHIGHLMPFLLTKWLQNAFKVNAYIQIPDEEKFLAKGVPMEEVESLVQEDILDIAALGFDPDRTFLFRNTEYAGRMYSTACRIARKITFSTAKAVFGFRNSSNIGFIFYPVMQAVPCFFERKRCLIPAALDQDPYWRVQRDVAEGLGHLKAAAIHSKFLPSLAGMEGKMSSSALTTAVYLSDSPEIVREKVMKHAFSGGGGSLKEHRERGGNPGVDVAFQWLKAFFEPDDSALRELEEGYRAGTVTTGEMKSRLIERLNAFLSSHRKRRSPNAAKKLMRTGRLARKMWSEGF